ncbi:MAG: dipeptidase [Pseudomonadales bacterium]|nr:dipeptidase [Pseudomonadales bacterium]MDG1443321.1 dipeptidase [Pseudomonadales bacterium]
MKNIGMLSIACLLSACAQVTPKQDAEEVALTGAEIANKYLIVDTHIDVPFRLHRKPANVGAATASGEFDYPRAKQGGLNVPFMSIYIPASVDAEGGATELADKLIDDVENIAAEHPDKFSLVTSASDALMTLDSGKVGLALGMENGAPIAGDLKLLRHFYDRGIRYITLTHSKSNHISDSSYDEARQWGGLSDFGEILVLAMNGIGMMVDVSHVSDDAFYDVIRISQVPVIASHSSARHFVPGFERNMDDDMLRALANNGGVMQLNIGSTFISAASRQSSDARTALAKAYVEENNLDPTSDEARAAAMQIFKENPLTFATMADVLDHVDHVVKIAGINHIGIGSDFDGVGDSLPIGFKDVSDYPNFIDGLIERGYSQADIEKILSGNIMRVWKTVEAYAAQNL